jgi:hypothetical protein
MQETHGQERLWSLNASFFINWDIPEKALETLENSAQVFNIKFAHDHLTTHAQDQTGQNQHMPRLQPHCRKQPDLAVMLFQGL